MPRREILEIPVDPRQTSRARLPLPRKERASARTGRVDRAFTGGASLETGEAFQGRALTGILLGTDHLLREEGNLGRPDGKPSGRETEREQSLQVTGHWDKSRQNASA